VTPFVVPLTVNVPVAEVPDAKHDVEELKVKLLTFTALPLLWESEAVKVKAVELSGLESVADQLPLIELELLPHPTSNTAVPNRIARHNLLMNLLRRRRTRE
jgi:hypothetical protein